MRRIAFRAIGHRRALAAVLLACLLSLLCTPAEAGARVALVIGNSDYTTLGRLPNPINDADAIASTLRGMDFQVTELTDLTVNAFAKGLSDFRRLASGADVAFVYYSGHGLQLNSENYLIAVDATLDFDTSLKYQSIQLDDVLDATRGAAVTLVFVDACRTIPVEGTFLASANERDVVARGPAPVRLEQTRSVFVGFSSSVGQTAEDGSGHNSPFTTAMVQKLPQQGFDVPAMFGAVSDTVRQMTDGRQVPQAFSDLPANVALISAAQTVAQVSGPDAEERAYSAASSVGTVNAYRAFIAKFPAGFYAELAREEISKLTGAEEPSSSSEEQATVEPPPTGLRAGLFVPSEMKEPDLSFYGTPTDTIGDWKISKGQNGRCYMVTEAIGVSPRGWIAYRPWVYFSTKADSDRVSSSLYTGGKTEATESFKTGTVSASVQRPDGSSHSIETKFVDTELRMLRPCPDKSGDLCIDNADVLELMAGDNLKVTGDSANDLGRGTVTYGISGYPEAAKRINEMCKANAGYLYNYWPK